MVRQTNLDDMIRAGAQCLTDGGIEDARRDARLLAGAALGKETSDLITQRLDPIDADHQAAFQTMIERRALGEPVSRIIGHRGFWTLDLRITPDVLDPRADSETLIETALGRIDSQAPPKSILDLGTGSGCLLLALLAEWPDAFGVGVDISPAALCLARANALTCGLAAQSRFVCADWTAALSGPFDLIISNPPYIVTSVIPTLDRDVANFDPMLALDGGTDGLDAYRALIPSLSHLLSPGGFAVLEVGIGQISPVKSLMKQFNLVEITVANDLSGKERCVCAKKPLD